MDMSMSMDGGSDSPLNASGVDFTNITQATDFLDRILDDSDLMIVANEYARNFWYGIVAVIAVCGIANAYYKSVAKLRLRSSATNNTNPARPANLLTKCMATVTAIFREISYAQYTPTARFASYFKVPPAGTIVLVAGYLGWALLMEFLYNDVEGAQYYTGLGVRAGWLACAQVPLLILLAGKNNLIGLISGVSYERLNVLHRWSSRVLLLLATFHMGFLHAAWNAYSLGHIEYATDSCIPTGFATYAILLWMNLSTLAPFRNFSYEFFVVQHIITWFGFVIALMYHIPAYYARVYIWIPIGLYLLDRLVRTARYAYTNIRPARATLTAMEGGVTKICVKSKQIKTWTPGSHFYLSIPGFGIGQSHPATIASTPTSHNGDLIFMLKTHKGFTSRIHKSAIDSTTSLLPATTTESTSLPIKSHLTLLDGPYGTPPDFATYDSLLLIAGSTGITFILPILLDIVSRAKAKLPVKRVTLLWMVKSTVWTSWVAAELQSASGALEDAGLEADMRIHVTCDDQFTDDGKVDEGEKACGCACDKSIGPCCCVSVVQDVSTSSSEDDEKKSVSIEKVKKAGDRSVVLTRSAPSLTSSSSSRSRSRKGTRNAVLPSATFHSGRPDVYATITDVLERAEGETAVVVCGPVGLNTAVRNSVVRCSDERAVHKGTGAQGVFLHAEGFGW